MCDLDSLGDGGRNPASGCYHGAHAGWILLNDDSAGGGAKSGKDLDTSTPVYVLQQERGEKEIRPRFERRVLDIVLENRGAQAMPDDTFLQAGEETPIQV